MVYSDGNGSWDQWAVFVKETLRRLDDNLKDISESMNNIVKNSSIVEFQCSENAKKIAALEKRLEDYDTAMEARILEDKKSRNLIIIAIIGALANILVAIL